MIRMLIAKVKKLQFWATALDTVAVTQRICVMILLVLIFFQTLHGELSVNVCPCSCGGVCVADDDNTIFGCQALILLDLTLVLAGLVIILIVKTSISKEANVQTYWGLRARLLTSRWLCVSLFICFYTCGSGGRISTVGATLNLCTASCCPFFLESHKWPDARTLQLLQITP